MTDDSPRIQVTKDGPYAVTGSVPLQRETIICDENGEPVEWRKGEALPRQDAYLLCRCGQSCDKPFCDGSHVSARFDGTETDSRRPYLERAQRLDGPGVVLLDAEELCAEARFCAAYGGLWHRIDDTADAGISREVEAQAGRCPSGRYVSCDPATAEAVEPDLEASIGLIEDPGMGVSGGPWVRGGIPVESADGSTYEVRNRMTLCRCGHSRNKPFCDGSHIDAGFSDERGGETP